MNRRSWLFALCAPLALAGGGVPLPSLAADIDAFVGKYRYVEYRVRLPNGRTLGLAQIGARSATLEILPTMKARLEMTMLDGRTTVSEARILNAKATDDGGWFMAQWPDMTYPVREEFTRVPGGFEYAIRFANASDPMRNGSREEATLQRIGGR